MLNYLGLDGFRGGWVAASIDDDGDHGFGRDDLIDAWACAIAAQVGTSRLGGDEVDSRGLRTEIIY